MYYMTYANIFTFQLKRNTQIYKSDNNNDIGCNEVLCTY